MSKWNYDLSVCIGLAIVMTFVAYDFTKRSAHISPGVPCWHISQAHAMNGFYETSTDYYSLKAPDIEGSFANFTDFFGQQYALAGGLTITKETCPAETSRPEKEAK